MAIFGQASCPNILNCQLSIMRCYWPTYAGLGGGGNFLNEDLFVQKVKLCVKFELRPSPKVYIVHVVKLGVVNVSGIAVGCFKGARR
jgi:hypothetical protein